VSNDLRSAKEILEIAAKHSTVKPALGFHPEQELPNDQEYEGLMSFIRNRNDQLYAIGEIGLPYYLRKEQLVKTVDPYVTLLESFLTLAYELDKPVVLHAIYDDAPLVCDLLEKHSIEKAHFHWFKGDKETIDRMIENGYS